MSFACGQHRWGTVDLACEIKQERQRGDSLDLGLMVRAPCATKNLASVWSAVPQNHHAHEVFCLFPWGEPGPLSRVLMEVRVADA